MAIRLKSSEMVQALDNRVGFLLDRRQIEFEEIVEQLEESLIQV